MSDTTNAPRRRGRGEAGSGAAIGVAMLFPALMGVIVALSMLTGSARAEQALQAAANRAARTAALCCAFTDGAQAAAHAGLASAEQAGTFNRVVCNNDLVADSRVTFEDVSGTIVPVAADAAVPAGGAVYVAVTCKLPPEVLGGIGFPGLEVQRTAVGVAAIDPFRARTGG
ncbi:MAG: hypothetical protein F4Z22_12860 [Acidimicrobiia bacterium]|nr:hypothetical protein [Acidimicrobiia bacterium]